MSALRALLDVNVLIALLDATHVFHSRAHSWWATDFASGWASCPFTEAGLTRIMTHPSYSASRRFTVEEIIDSLSHFTANTNHEFWTDTLTLRDRDIFVTERIHGSRQLTDLYLLALAAKHGGRLVTFDQNIPISAVKTATRKSLLVLQ